MKHRTQHLALLILGLFGLGSLIFFYRWFYLHVPLKPTTTTQSWTVEASVKFVAGNMPIKVHLYIPNHPKNFFILDENFVSRHYGVTTQRTPAGDRIATWSIRRAHGRQNLYYRLVLHRGENNFLSHLSEPERIEKPVFEGLQKQAAESLVQTIRSRSADIETFVSEAIRLINNRANSQAALLLNRDWDRAAVAALTIKILAYANISARYVQGSFLSLTAQSDMFPWLVIFKNHMPIYYNPQTGESGLPKDFLIWSHSQVPIVTLKGGHLLNFNLATTQNTLNALQLAEQHGAHINSKLIKFSLLSLPLQIQQIFHIILMVPVGALIILFLRQYIGLVTFGTFMPVLIALAFREIQLLWGSILLSFIVAVGLLVRFYLEQLQLLFVPRLSAVLTVVVLLMVMLSVLGHQLGLDHNLSVALFPMVIVTMTIERMCVLWEERGPTEAIQTGLGSLLAAACVYAVMHHRPLEYLLFAFPELLFILLALILFCGQYTGYRLSELIRFKAFYK